MSWIGGYGAWLLELINGQVPADQKMLLTWVAVSVGKSSKLLQQQPVHIHEAQS
jgi:hypothetical protein